MKNLLVLYNPYYNQEVIEDEDHADENFKKIYKIPISIPLGEA